jgi:hypothetical protein
MKRCGNAPKGSKQHRLNVSSGFAESGYVSSVLDECRRRWLREFRRRED